MKKSILKQSGLTLIELILVIMLMGIVAATSSALLSQGLNGFLNMQKLIEANWQGQLAMARMTRDMADCRSANDITTFTSGTFAFTDINANSITYTSSGSNLTRNGNVLAYGISNLTFAYYDQNGNAGPAQANIHYVQISFTVTEDNTNYNMSSGVFLRGLST
jgi:prepilin-type N-terminal cleavage/methylation domain-containing protein